MPTVWMPERYSAKRVWLLDNGQIIEQPDLEVSGAGRRVRVKDRPETSVWAKERATIIKEAVEQAAQRAGAEILTCLHHDRAIANDNQLPEVALEMQDGLKSLNCEWTFVHSSLPLTAKVIVYVAKHYGGRYRIGAKLSFDEVSQASRHKPQTASVERGAWDIHRPGQRWGEENAAIESALASTGYAELFQERAVSNEREAVRHLRDLIDRFNQWLTVVVPDTRDPTHVEWITLDFHATNVDGTLLGEVNNYLQSETLVEQVAEKFNELRELIRYLGITMEGKSPEDFQRACTATGSEVLEVELSPNSEYSSHRHSVYLNLATGTLSVTCGYDDEDEDRSQEWNLARFEAEMRGELDAFLAYHHDRARKVARHNIIDVVEARTA